MGLVSLAAALGTPADQDYDDDDDSSSRAEVYEQNRKLSPPHLSGQAKLICRIDEMAVIGQILMAVLPCTRVAKEPTNCQFGRERRHCVHTK